MLGIDPADDIRLLATVMKDADDCALTKRWLSL
ncbi:hypothetical protein FIV00_18960 [Labrenzia sp. THAF82]|nr:hypothetical protein FIV00_18960 [Labrenzia sp. THAF82]